MSQLSRQGISFNYFGDTITYSWPWARSGRRRFSSSLHARDFNHFREYWQVVGACSANLRLGTDGAKVVGLGMHEVLAQYVKYKYPGEYIVALCDINPAAKDSSFWRKIPAQYAEQLLKDVAIFRCKSRDQMLDISLGTSTDFAVAYSFENGILVDSNLWKDVDPE
ncbi:MAG TPA: hypothetical protein VFM18_21125 [Methanosarcina sp.]|nr:hypothetical protein [Methanosarcina sp.]